MNMILMQFVEARSHQVVEDGYEFFAIVSFCYGLITDKDVIVSFISGGNIVEKFLRSVAEEIQLS